MLRALLFVLVLALTACATRPEDQPTLLSPKPDDGRGRIVLRPFYVPSGLNIIAGLLGGGTTAFKATLYDVTAQPRYLGEIFSQGVLSDMGPIQNAFEYDVEPGKRVLMLHQKRFGGGDIVDFAEVSVGANQIEHVAISQYGMNDRPFLVNLDFDQRASRYCGYTKGLKRSEAADWAKTQGIPETKFGLARYCQALSSHTRFRAAQVAPWPPAPTMEQVAAMRDRYLPDWRAMADKTPPYDVAQPIDTTHQNDRSRGGR